MWLDFFVSMIDTDALALHDSIVNEADPLTLDLEDEEYIDIIDDWVSNSQQYYERRSLLDRQKKNLAYYLGDQQKLSDTTDDRTPYVENIVYEAVRRIKPIAASRLPDLTVKPGSEDPQAIKNARVLTDIFNSDINRRETRKLFGIAHVHEQLMFYAVIKARWNTEIGTDGDSEFVNVYPTNVVWDHTCKTNNADDMLFVAEFAEYMVKELIMMFPKKREEFLAYLGMKFPNTDMNSEKGMATKIKVSEVWFHWYKDYKINGETKWEKINAVVWKYGTFVLGKMRNPYFDYEGKPMLFSKEIREKGLPTTEDIYNMLFGAQDQVQNIYYNYFKSPRKPYFFMVYESLGSDPIDATNRVEQLIPMQDNLNSEGSQIVQMNKQSAGKLLLNTDALDKDSVEKINFTNTSEAISVNGEDINKSYAHLNMPPATPQLYNSLERDRKIGFEMAGVGETTRGISSGDNTLGQDQMNREQDFGFIDDLVEETINEAAEWMAQWKMQFIRCFYTKAHMVDAVGKDGVSLYTAVTQDLVNDGMSAVVSASGVDKQKRVAQAVKNMELGVGDILTYYMDTNQSQPQERARKAFLQKTSPMQYYQEFLAPKNETGVPGPVQPGQGMPPQPGADQGATAGPPLPPEAPPPPMATPPMG